MPGVKEGKTWSARFYYEDWTGKRIQVHKRGFAKKGLAEDYEKEFMNKYERSPNMLVGSLYELYLERMADRNRKSTLYNKKNIYVNHILPYFKNKKVNEVTASDIDSWQSTMLRKGYSDTYLRTLNSKLSSLFNFAVTFCGLRTNPCHALDTIGSKTTTSIDFWTLEEFKQFLPAVEDKIRSQLGFELLYWTGMRIGEMLALTPEDFRLKKNHVRINKTWQIVEGQEVIGPPKTKNGTRHISVPGNIYDKVFKYLDMLYECKDTDRIFEGTSKYYFAKEMQRGCNITGVKKIRVHDLRHSHVSLLIDQGFNDYLIAERIGDTVNEVQKTYAHLYPQRGAEIGTHLEKLQ